MNTKNIIIYIIMCLIIIAGIAVWDSQGFNSELQYSSRKQIQLSNKTGIEVKDVEDIVSEVLGKETKFFVQPVETFGNSVSVVAEDINKNQKNEIVKKFNEKYNYNLKEKDVAIISIPFTRVKDIVKTFMIPGIITLIIVILYFLIRFRKLGILSVFLKTALFPIVAELLLFSILAIVRIPFGRIAVALGVGLYISMIAMLTNHFENKKTELDKTEKERKED